MSYDINIYHYGEVVKRFEGLDKRAATELYNQYSLDECIYTQLIRDGTPLNTYQAERELNMHQRKVSGLAATLGRSAQCAVLKKRGRQKREGAGM